MRLSLAQIDSGTDKAQNLAPSRRLARRAADDGADLVAFPEYSMYEKKVVDASFGPAAEPLDGPFVTGARVSRLLASASRSWSGWSRRTTTAHGRSTHSWLIDPAGALLARYRKIHLFDSYGFCESASITPSPSVSPWYSRSPA